MRRSLTISLNETYVGIESWEIVTIMEESNSFRIKCTLMDCRIRMIPLLVMIQLITLIKNTYIDVKLVDGPDPESPGLSIKQTWCDSCSIFRSFLFSLLRLGIVDEYKCLEVGFLPTDSSYIEVSNNLFENVLNYQNLDYIIERREGILASRAYVSTEHDFYFSLHYELAYSILADYLAEKSKVIL